MKKLFTLVLVAATIAGCTKEDSKTTPSAANAEATAMSKAQAATAAAATNANGLTKGTDLVVTSSTGLKAASTNFNAETDCAISGWPATGTEADPGYAMKFLMCSVLKRPDGPDTVRGGFDRITGFLCAVGPVTYDGTTRSVTATFSTACFSQTFLTQACTLITGSASNGPCTTPIAVTGHSSVTGVAPAQFDKYVTMSALNDQVQYTVAFKSTETSVSGAMMSGLPTTAAADVEDAFAFHIDASSGKLRYEGRFTGDNKRHMRINLIGAVSTALEVTDVATLSFVQGENFTNGSGLIVSVDGTLAAGRRLRIRKAASLASPTWVQGNSTDDNACIGEAGATCTGNSGIVATDTKYFFQSGSAFTDSKTWFTTHSYLGSVSDTVDMDDVWN